MPNEIYDSMIQPRGQEYRSSQIKPYSHYREPIDDAPGRLAGNSRVWGDASPEVQSRSIDLLIDASRNAGLTPRETAHVLAIARQESGFNPDAASNESASGLGQFIDGTGRSYGLNNQNRFDAGEGARALVEHFIDNRNLARSRGQGEEYIYKYHHDGPLRDYGGLGLSNQHVMPRLDEYERFVNQRLAQRTDQPGQTTTQPTPGQSQTTPDAQTPTGPRSFDDVMRTMLPTQGGVNPHVTSRFGHRTLNGRPDDHGGVDFNYVGGQNGVNLRHPTVHSPVSGEVVFSGGQYGTVKIRDGQGNLHEILHLDSRSVQVTNPPTRVEAGDPIGTMGGRGPARADQYAQHVHYQVREAGNLGTTVDPVRFWNNRTVDGPTQPGTEQRTQGQQQTPAPAAALREGDRGPQVIALQETLNRLGYTGRDGKPLETTSGVFGPETKHAVESLQRAHGVGVDGVVGRDTRGALASAAERPLLTEATHPANGLYTALARQLPGARPEQVAHVTMQAMENDIGRPERIGRVEVSGNNVMVRGSNFAVDPGDRVAVDLAAPTANLQQMSDHVRQQAAQPDQERDRPTPVQDDTLRVRSPVTLTA